MTVEKAVGTMGHEMTEVDAKGGKMKGRKEVSVDVIKQMPITEMMTERKEPGKKGITEKAVVITTKYILSTK